LEQSSAFGKAEKPSGPKDLKMIAYWISLDSTAMLELFADTRPISKNWLFA
jgi:hypothetical protein